MSEPAPDSAIERWVDKIMRWLTPLILAYIATLATNNHNTGENIEKKVESVQTTQQEAVVKTEAVKTALDTRAAKVDKETDDQRRATAAILYGNWKYLDGIATTPDEIKEAANAKRRYDEFSNKK